MNEIALKWYKQAKHDLEMAEKNISIGGYDVSAFLCQQAVEKLLKSIFALQGKSIRKTHYIDELAKELELSQEIIDKVIELTADYTISRYPDIGEVVPYEEYDEDIAKEKVKIAKEIFDSLTKQYNIWI